MLKIGIKMIYENITRIKFCTQNTYKINCIVKSWVISPTVFSNSIYINLKIKT